MQNTEKTKEAVFYNALNIAARPGYGTLRKQYARHGSWEECWRHNRASTVDPEREWAALQDRGIGLALISDPDYPPLLREIPDPPFGIYFRGSFGASNNSLAIAVVGTRKASAAGRGLATEFGSALARVNCVVVSGMAFGIDTASHYGAIKAGGQTVAVLASGLNRVYPASNQRLADHIIESGGALVSEYAPGNPPLGYRFLERNRIISGLARAVVAIEVPERSGVLATVRYALDQNRDIFVVPGSVNDPNYRGANRLIRRGAVLVTGPDDLLEDLGFEAGERARHIKTETPEEESVLRAMRDAGRPLAIDEIVEAATLTSSTANQSLTTLILKGTVGEEGGRYILR